jgi:hypothetical protein
MDLILAGIAASRTYFCDIALLRVHLMPPTPTPGNKPMERPGRRHAQIIHFGGHLGRASDFSFAVQIEVSLCQELVRVSSELVPDRSVCVGLVVVG